MADQNRNDKLSGARDQQRSQSDRQSSSSGPDRGMSASNSTRRQGDGDPSAADQSASDRSMSDRASSDRSSNDRSSSDQSSSDQSQVGRVGSSSRSGQGGYGADTGFEGGTRGSQEGMQDGAQEGTRDRSRDQGQR